MRVLSKTLFVVNFYWKPPPCCTCRERGRERETATFITFVICVCVLCTIRFHTFFVVALLCVSERQQRRRQRAEAARQRAASHAPKQLSAWIRFRFVPYGQKAGPVCVCVRVCECGVRFFIWPCRFNKKLWPIHKHNCRYSHRYIRTVTDTTADTATQAQLQRQRQAAAAQ